jgi:hypothetical protein
MRIVNFPLNTYKPEDGLMRPKHAGALATREINHGYIDGEPPLWSSGQSFWLQIQRSRVRFPALSDLLRSRGSGTGSTQPHEGNGGAT